VDALPPAGGDRDVTGGPETDPIRAVERRLIQADNPRDIALWIQIRGEIMRQNEEALDRRAARQQRTEAARAELAKGFFAVSLGVYLIQSGYWLAGFLCLGAGLYSLAPDYIKQFNPLRQRNEADDDQE
jgi:hypothetical protein